MRARGVTPHMAANTSRRSSAIDGRTTRHRSYALSQRLRKRVEDIFGWMKTGGRIPEDALPMSEPHRGVAMGTRSDVERHVGRGTKAHSPPSHISKTVLSTVHSGPSHDFRPVVSDAEGGDDRGEVALQSWAALPPMTPCHNHAAADFGEHARTSHISKMVPSS